MAVPIPSDTYWESIRHSILKANVQGWRLLPSNDSIINHHFTHVWGMTSSVQSGRLREALASTQPQATCGNSCLPELLETLQLEMLKRVLDGGAIRKHEYLARSDVKDVLARLMALLSLQIDSDCKKCIFDCIVKTYYPERVKIFFDTFTLYIHDDTQRQNFLKNVRSAMEQYLYSLLLCMELETYRSMSKERLRKLQKTFSDLIQAMAIPLHDDTVPTIRRDEAEHHPLFTRAVKMKLAPEALLLYDAGAVGNKELGLLAEDPDVQKMLQSEDESVLAVFLRKVLHKPRSLQSLATMQVSRLLVCHAPKDKEQTARGLGLLDYHVERVLLRQQCGRYREALKLANDEDKAGASQ